MRQRAALSSALAFHGMVETLLAFGYHHGHVHPANPEPLAALVVASLDGAVMPARRELR